MGIISPFLQTCFAEGGDIRKRMVPLLGANNPNRQKKTEKFKIWEFQSNFIFHNMKINLQIYFDFFPDVWLVINRDFLWYVVNSPLRVYPW